MTKYEIFLKIVFLFLFANTAFSFETGYVFTPYSNNDYENAVDVLTGDYKEHPSFVNDSAHATLRWFRNELVGKYPGIYTIRESTRSKSKQSKNKILTITYADKRGRRSFSGIRVQVYSTCKSIIVDDQCHREKKYTYKIHSVYRVGPHKNLLNTLLNREFNDIEEIVNEFHKHNVINRYYAAGQEKYNEYQEYIKGVRILNGLLNKRITDRNHDLVQLKQQRLVFKRLIIKKNGLSIIMREMPFEMRGSGNSPQYVTTLQDFDICSLLKQNLIEHFDIEGLIFESRSSRGQYRLVLPNEQYESLMSRL